MIKSPVDNKIEDKKGHSRKTEGHEGIMDRSFEVDVMGNTKEVPVVKKDQKMRSYFEGTQQRRA